MATRFYFDTTDYTDNTPAFDSGWEQTPQAFRKKLIRKTRLSAPKIITNFAATIPNTTTQDILNVQFTSEPIPAQNITGTVSMVVSALEVAATANATLALVVRVISQDGATVRGTLFSVFGTDTEFPTTAATRIVNAQNITALTTQPGDRLVVEVGAHAAAPTATDSSNLRFGDNNAADFALTSALTTDLNPWIEFSQNLWATDFENYRFMKSGEGMSLSERIR